MGMVVINNLLAGLTGKVLPTLVSILLVSPWDAQLTQCSQVPECQ